MIAIPPLIYGSGLATSASSNTSPIQLLKRNIPLISNINSDLFNIFIFLFSIERFIGLQVLPITYLTLYTVSMLSIFRCIIYYLNKFEITHVNQYFFGYLSLIVYCQSRFQRNHNNLSLTSLDTKDIITLYFFLLYTYICVEL